MTAISIIATQTPFDVLKNLRLLQVRAVRIEEPSQSFHHRCLLVFDPARLDQFLQLVVQLIGAFDGYAFHGFSLSRHVKVRNWVRYIKTSTADCSADLTTSSNLVSLVFGSSWPALDFQFLAQGTWCFSKDFG